MLLPKLKDLKVWPNDMRWLWLLTTACPVSLQLVPMPVQVLPTGEHSGTHTHSPGVVCWSSVRQKRHLRQPGTDCWQWHKLPQCTSPTGHTPNAGENATMLPCATRQQQHQLLPNPGAAVAAATTAAAGGLCQAEAASPLPGTRGPAPAGRQRRWHFGEA